MAASMSLLWGVGSTPCWRVMITLEEKQLQGYKSKLLSYDKEELQSPEVLKINPRAQLPTFKHGDNIVNESCGACLYLENQFKLQGTKLIPDSTEEQALMYQRMMEGANLTEIIHRVVYFQWFFLNEEERHDSALKRFREALVTELKLWERYLEEVAEGSYLAGAFSLADVVVFTNIAYAFRFGLSFERYPILTKYYNLLKDRPSIKATWPPRWTDSPNGYEALKDI
ncbi:glutathione S-transferase A-like [Notolabrus celidotus]|uniref:glutathione S-transferase A-like n=1 Tax=Notolabrus celidotus TaxID=1203425 RepID=UPI00148FBFEB|nr:glutathione S-transferase A-like [Notolabrus celidotus]